MASLLTFNQALDRAAGYARRHLLLGNGFSIACEPEIFTYGSLFERAKPDMSAELLAVFERLNTTDFEDVIRALRRAAEIVPIYGNLPKTAARMNVDAEALKAALVKAVAGQHPARPNLIADRRYAACRRFLAKFIGAVAGGKVYTLNYDLLLYWALMHEPEFPDGLGLDHDDGFRKDPEDWEADYVIWHGESHANSQNVHYLHGAMHLYDAGAQLQKYTWINTGKALVDQANEALAADLFPLFVAEATSGHKLAKIQHSAYLHHSYKSFCTVCMQGAKTALFIYGHSLADNDRHILDRISRSKLAHLFISLYGDPDSPANHSIRAAAGRIAARRVVGAPALKLDFYDAETAEVWG
jgi:Domain of unknown function (DUF4917)